MPRRNTLGWVIASATLMAALPASADPPQVRVSFRDLDLSTREGAETLLHRLRDAAEEACRGDSPSVTDQMQARIRRCRNDTLSQTVEQLRNPTVTAAFSDLQPVLYASR